MTNTEFVQALYNEVLGRPGDAQGLKFWQRMLDAGLMSRAQVNSEIRNSTEATKYIEAQIHNAYSKVLRRSADTQGMTFWMDEVRSGRVSAAQLPELFRQTPEYLNNPRLQEPGLSDPYTPDGGGPGDDADGDGTGEPDPVNGETPGTNPGDATTDGGSGTVGDSDPYGRENARATIQLILERYGMGSLTDEIVRLIGDNANEANIRLAIYNTDEFKTRFPGISYEGGDWVGKFTPEQYLEYERTALGIMQAAGLPTSFYDHYTDFTEFIERNVTLVDLADRVQEGFTRVAQAPVEVRQQFAQWFGPQGDGALAAYFLQPERAMRVMQEQMAAAEIAGMGSILGTSGLDQARATQLAQMGYDGQNSQGVFRQLQAQDSLFNETITEGDDLSRVDEGVDAAFGLDEEAADKIERRRAARVNNLRGGGGMLVTQEGIGGRADQ